MASPQCTVQVSINGGAYVSGFQPNVPFGATLQFRNIVAANVTGYSWSLLDYPPGLSLPAGWSNVNGVYVYAGATPPEITLPSTGPLNWGMIPVALNINSNPLQYNSDGSLNPAYNPAYLDTSCVISVNSPNFGMPGLCFALGNQYDALRQWVGPLMASLRDIDNGGSVVSANVQRYTTATYASAPVAWPAGYTGVNVNTSAGTAANAQLLPAVPYDTQEVTLRLTGGVVGSLPFAGTGSQLVENPAAPGHYSAAAGGWTLPPGVTQTLQWGSTESTWFLA